MALPRVELRLKVLVLAVAASFLALLIVLWHMQVIKGEDYRRRSTGNRIRLVKIRAPRGLIYDRNGRILADNRPGFEVMVNPDEVPDRAGLIRRLADVLGTPAPRLSRRMEAFRRKPFEPVRVADDIGIARATVLEEMTPELSGVTVQVHAIRNYPYGSGLAHLLGYLGQISPAELKRLRPEGYLPQDYIGKVGVEAAYDRELKGQPGGEQLQVDAHGLRDKLLSEKAPVPGNSLYLALDLKAQLILSDLMEGRKGAAVLLSPRNGDLLALVSRPSFDSNLLLPPVPRKYLEGLFSSSDSPLLNRAIAGEYPPGSPFKLVVAAAALKTQAITPQTVFDCREIFSLGAGSFRCWKAGGHGPLNLVEAIQHSCNIYFYQAGLKTGLDRIRPVALRMGLGEKTGLEIPGEKAGFLPGRSWKKAAFGESWYPGDTINLSIGQGYILVTPLQLAGVGCVIASGGELYRPRIVTKVTSVDGQLVEEYPPILKRKLNLSPFIWKVLREGMYRVVNTEDGTGRAAAPGIVSVSGKTGTAQVGSPPDYRNHAWFLSFAPADDPQMVLAVILENAGSGGKVAAPLAREFYQRYFQERQ